MPIEAIYGPFCTELVDTFVASESGGEIITEGGESIIPEGGISEAYGVECNEGDEVCCIVPTKIFFNDVARTEIAYGPQLTALHGTAPAVYVYYFEHGENGDAFFRIGGIYTRVTMKGVPLTKITVDHGGLATGYVIIR